MSKYRKKPVVIEATQWFRNGDHPKDYTNLLDSRDGVEGKVVRYFRHPGIGGQDHCKQCDTIMHDHGWIDTLEGGHIVCPGDWIITGVSNENYPCKSDIFDMTYDKVE